MQQYIDVTSALKRRVSTFWLCNTTKKIDGVKTILDCHAKYHVERKLFVTTTSNTASSENSAISDVTEE
jgi:hypothetical protein